jgi:hypothetical protein
MSNELRKKLHDLAELSENTTDPQTKAIVEAIPAADGCAERAAVRHRAAAGHAHPGAWKNTTD